MRARYVSSGKVSSVTVLCKADTLARMQQSGSDCKAHLLKLPLAGLSTREMTCMNLRWQVNCMNLRWQVEPNATLQASS